MNDNVKKMLLKNVAKSENKILTLTLKYKNDILTEVAKYSSSKYELECYGVKYKLNEKALKTLEIFNELP